MAYTNTITGEKLSIRDLEWQIKNECFSDLDAEYYFDHASEGHFSVRQLIEKHGLTVSVFDGDIYHDFKNGLALA